MSFKDKIPGCFGTVDKIFAGHPLDQGRAKDMLIAALQETESWSEFENAIREYLSGEGCRSEHIDKQIERVKKVNSYFSD